MKVAVLGYNGFIGKNLCAFLHPRFEVVEVSLRKENWKKKLQSCEVYINLIGKAHDHKGEATESDYFFANSNIHKDVIDIFKESTAKLYIHISSLAAQEEIKSTKALSEEDSCKPVSAYGKSKRDFEQWISRQEFDIDKKVIILRPPMVHGPGDKGNLGLLHQLISKGIPYPLNAFNNKRSFLSIDNFCFFINQIISNREKIANGIYNISDDESISTSKIIDIIKQEENKRIVDLNFPKFVIKAIAKIGDVLPIPLNTVRLEKMTSNLLVSNQKIKTALGIHKLPTTAEEGLRKTIRSFTRK